MNIDASNSRTTRTAPTPPRRFPPERLATDDFSLGDWRPGVSPRKKCQPKPLDAFTRSQKEKLLQLRAALLNSINGVALDLCVEQSDSSAFDTHNGDAGSDACDRDYALCLLSKEKNALVEIDEALERIETGTYGICEMSGEPIPALRLKAIPFARFTVEWQSEIEKRKKALSGQRSLPSPFTVADDEEIGEREENSF